MSDRYVTQRSQFTMHKQSGSHISPLPSIYCQPFTISFRLHIFVDGHTSNMLSSQTKPLRKGDNPRGHAPTCSFRYNKGLQVGISVIRILFARMQVKGSRASLGCQQIALDYLKSLYPQRITSPEDFAGPAVDIRISRS